MCCSKKCFLLSAFVSDWFWFMPLILVQEKIPIAGFFSRVKQYSCVFYSPSPGSLFRLKSPVFVTEKMLVGAARVKLKSCVVASGVFFYF